MLTKKSKKMFKAWYETTFFKSFKDVYNEYDNTFLRHRDLVSKFGYYMKFAESLNIKLNFHWNNISCDYYTSLYVDDIEIYVGNYKSLDKTMTKLIKKLNKTLNNSLEYE